jgi:type IV secretory pathway TrbD component
MALMAPMARMPAMPPPAPMTPMASVASMAPTAPMVPTAHPIHPALWRAILIAGVDRGFCIIEATLVAALVVMGGLDWRTLSAAALLVGVLHPAIAWATRLDAEIGVVYVRSLGGQDFYPPVASFRAPVPAVRAALPPLKG